MLNEMRLGKITDDTVKAFKKLSRKLEYHAQLEATELCVHPNLFRRIALIDFQLPNQK
jgi:hypothetical protein